MARAKRHYLPGYIWHITHRCHKREFLLKFSKDRHWYLQWLYHARRRYGLSILNYLVTSNHAHLLVEESAGYNGFFGAKNSEIGGENAFLWDINR
jgi:putative transposase